MEQLLVVRMSGEAPARLGVAHRYRRGLPPPLSAQMAGGAELPLPQVRAPSPAPDGGILATWYAEQLRLKDAEIERLTARLAALEARGRWADHDLPPVALAPTLHALVEALLPPGVGVHRDELARRVWPDCVAARVDAAHLVRVNISRLRAAFHPHGWTIPGATTRSEYLLLRPGEPVPADYVANRRAATLPYLEPLKRAREKVACPECDGVMNRESPRCARCTVRRKTTRRRPEMLVCPTCAGPKSWNAVQCQACDLARRMKRVELP
jgi:hypothetical protein